MSEAPKRIWVEPADQELGWWEDGEPETDTQYIHADIVEEMREALNKIKDIVCGDGYANWADHDKVYFSRGKIADIADATLKLLEEE